jgi:hypothetical protein
MDGLFLVLGIALVAWLGWQVMRMSSNRAVQQGPVMLPVGVTLYPQELLAEQELSLYNLLRLVVQDRYLVFVRVPLWSVLGVEAEGRSRLQVLRHLALKSLDVVLVHPGSRIVEQVVLWEDNRSADPSEKVRIREIHVLLQAAGIKTTTLPSRSSYTVQQLGELLGVDDSE